MIHNIVLCIKYKESHLVPFSAFIRRNLALHHRAKACAVHLKMFGQKQLIHTVTEYLFINLHPLLIY